MSHINAGIEYDLNQNYSGLIETLLKIMVNGDKITYPNIRINEYFRYYFAPSALKNVEKNFIENGNKPIQGKKCFMCCQAGCCKNFIELKPGDVVTLEKVIKISTKTWDGKPDVEDCFVMLANGKRVIIHQWTVGVMIRYWSRWSIVREKQNGKELAAA